MPKIKITSLSGNNHYGGGSFSISKPINNTTTIYGGGGGGYAKYGGKYHFGKGGSYVGISKSLGGGNSINFTHNSNGFNSIGWKWTGSL